MIDDEISYNFSIAKVLSILMVVAGHFFSYIQWLPLWIPTTVALFVFAFSSGYFTSKKYNDNFSFGEFWKAKFLRLIPSLVVINFFLLVVFISQQRPGILSWHTLLSVTGVSGFLTWFKVANISPFGNGLWFFTLLLIFYLCYPLLDRANRHFLPASLAVFAMLLITSIFHFQIKMGVSLWITAFAFCFGVYSGRFSLRINPLLPGIIAILSVVAMLALNLKWQIKSYNYFLLLFICISAVSFLMNSKLSVLPLKVLLVLANCVLEIYFIHTYLFIHPLGYSKSISFIISCSVIILTSLILSRISQKLRCLSKTTIVAPLN